MKEKWQVKLDNIVNSFKYKILKERKVFYTKDKNLNLKDKL